MPFLAPLIGGLIGGIAATTLGQALIGGALSLAMGAIAKRIAPKPDTQSAMRGAHLRLAADTQMPRVVIFGEAAVAGSLVYHNVYNSTANLELVIALADHECEAMTGLWVDGVAVAWDADTGLVEEYAGMRVRFYSGAWDQDADTDLVANSGDRWASTARGRGIAYAYVNMAYDANLYKGRTPNLLFRIKGAKLYDWRKDDTAGGDGDHRWGEPDTYAWTDNPAVAWYNYRRGLFVDDVRVAGMSTAADALPLDAATAAANACEEAVDLKAGGSEPRYRISAAIVTGQAHREIIRDIVSCVAGEEVDTGGELRLMPGIAQAPALALTDADLISDKDVEWSGRQSRRGLVNAVFGSFRDPAQRYEMVDSVPRLSSGDETTDGTRLEQKYGLDFVSSATQAQRVLEILRRRARRQGVARATFRATACGLEPGDWISWTSDRYGWETKTFEVVSSAVGRDLSTELVLRETDTGVYDWTAETDELDSSAVPDLPPGNTGITALSGLDVETIVVTSTATTAERPGLQLTWTAVTDPSVVEIEIETRKVGDATPLGSRKAYDPGAGQHAWVDGIIGGTDYEVRARPVTLPPRAVTWSAWIAPDDPTAPQVVDVGTLVPEPGSVGPAALDAQTLFELRLATALDAVQGSSAATLAEMLAAANAAAEQGLANVLEANRIDRKVQTVTSALNGNIAQVQEVLETVDGIKGRWGVVINVNGHVVGLVQLDGSIDGSAFTVVADKFVVAKPDGTGATPVFVVGDVDGSSAVGIDGTLIVDGTILARSLDVVTLSAIAADIGEVTAGVLRSSDNKMIIDLDDKSIVMEV